jgi:hypothetical protein
MAASSIVGTSLAMKGPETMTSIASLPSTRDQGAIDPFERPAVNDPSARSIDAN